MLQSIQHLSADLSASGKKWRHNYAHRARYVLADKAIRNNRLKVLTPGTVDFSQEMYRSSGQFCREMPMKLSSGKKDIEIRAP